MLYELDCANFAKGNGSNRLKMNASSSIAEKEILSEIPKSSNNSNNKVYGPELPSNHDLLSNRNKNISITNTWNGKSYEKEDSSSENEMEVSSSDQEKRSNNTPQKDVNSKSVMSNNSTSYSNLNKLLPSNHVNNKVESSSNSVVPSIQSMTKLVPYDDESNSSEESSSNSPVENNSRLSTAAAVGEWKVTSTTNDIENSMSKSEWSKKKSNSTVNELLKMSHSGYTMSVTSWNGNRAQLESEVINEKKEERKRCYIDDEDQGRTKHVKTVNNHFKSNPGYNPIQVSI